MRFLGDLSSLGGIPAAAWVVRCIVRDILNYRWNRAVLRRTSEDQVANVIRALNASPRDVRK